MYEYSPIRKIYIRNFRNLGDVELSFEKSPIISLVGENEAGKTSVIKAFATCALHANPRDQKDYIRDGTKMFGVAIEFENGKRITRIKEASGINSYQITDENGNIIWNTNKISEGLPVEVQNLMGLIAEPETNEFLHIRTYEDKLLFVVTPNSTNYKVMYNALKVEQLTKAIKLGSTEVNSLKSAISSNDSSIETLQSQIKSIPTYDLEPLTNVKNRLSTELNLLNKIEQAKTLADRINANENELGALVLIDKFNLNSIDMVVANKLNSVSRLLNNNNNSNNLLSRFKDVCNLEEIDTSIINKLYNIIEKNNILNSKISKAGHLVEIAKLDNISETAIIQLNKAISLKNRLDNNLKQLNTINTSDCKEITESDIKNIHSITKVITNIDTINTKKNELSNINNYIEQVQNYMKQCGVAVETCPNCGNDVIFDIDKIGV